MSGVFSWAGHRSRYSTAVVYCCCVVWSCVQGSLAWFMRDFLSSVPPPFSLPLHHQSLIIAPFLTLMLLPPTRDDVGLAEQTLFFSICRLAVVMHYLIEFSAHQNFVYRNHQLSCENCDDNCRHFPDNLQYGDPSDKFPTTL